MILETTDNGTFVLVKIVVAEAGITVADEFKRELSEIIASGKKRLVVDFSEVAYVDSSFLGALVSGLKQAIANNGDIGLMNLNKDIHNLFKLIRMDKIFRVYKDSMELTSLANQN